MPHGGTGLALFCLCDPGTNDPAELLRVPQMCPLLQVLAGIVGEEVRRRGPACLFCLGLRSQRLYNVSGSSWSGGRQPEPGRDLTAAVE